MTETATATAEKPKAVAKATQFVLLVEFESDDAPTPEAPHIDSKGAHTTEDKSEPKAAAKPAPSSPSGPAPKPKAFGPFEDERQASAWGTNHDLGARVKNATPVELVVPVH